MVIKSAPTMTARTHGKGSARKQDAKAKAKTAAAAQALENVRAAQQGRDAADPSGWSRSACVAWLQSHGAYTGMSRKSIEELRARIAEMQAGITPAPAIRSGRRAKTTDPATAIAAAREAREADTPADQPPADETPAAARSRRITAAKSEAAALKAWQQSGEQGPRPDTTNLDAIAAGRPARAPKSSTRRSAAPAIPDGATEHVCSGACGQTLPIVKFPTIGGGRRGSECRKCRDERRTAKTA